MPIPTEDTIVVAPTPNPMRADDTIDHDKLAANVEKWLDTELSGFVIVTHGGEELQFGEPDKLETVKTVVQAHKGQRFVIAGIDSPASTEVIRLANLYADAGADMIRVRIPGARPGGRASSGNVQYFEEVCEGSPIPIVVIHQPRASLTPDTNPRELAEITALDNVFSYILSLNYRWECGIPPSIHESTQLWTCNGSIVLPGQMIGAVGACMFFANWAPGLVKKIIDLGKAGNYAEANKLQQSMLHADFLGMTLGTAALKSGLNMLGYDTTVPRKPSLPLTPEQEAELREAFKECALL